jgi:hypothetical protein
MSGAIPPLPNMHPWRDAQLKQRNNFTFTCTFTQFFRYLLNIYHVECPSEHTDQATESFLNHPVHMCDYKGKIVPVLFFNRAPRPEGVLGEWRYSSTHSLTSALN